MLAPMVLARPDRAWFLAGLTTVASVLGGVAGYAIGTLAMEAVMPLLENMGYMDEFQRAQDWFTEWGFWAILAAGFSPIPYKVFTIAAGAMSMLLIPFVIASAVGRGARFFLVALLVSWGGPAFEKHLKRYVDVIGWLLVVLIVAAYFIFRG
jgi:membrane protein YqaA with SNARE-associated domain